MAAHDRTSSPRPDEQMFDTPPERRTERYGNFFLMLFSPRTTLSRRHSTRRFYDARHYSTSVIPPRTDSRGRRARARAPCPRIIRRVEDVTVRERGDLTTFTAHCRARYTIMRCRRRGFPAFPPRTNERIKHNNTRLRTRPYNPVGKLERGSGGGEHFKILQSERLYIVLHARAFYGVIYVFT